MIRWTQADKPAFSDNLMALLNIGRAVNDARWAPTVLAIGSVLALGCNESKMLNVERILRHC